MLWVKTVVVVIGAFLTLDLVSLWAQIQWSEAMNNFYIIVDGGNNTIAPTKKVQISVTLNVLLAFLAQITKKQTSFQTRLN